MQTDPVVPSPVAPRSKLTGRQRWAVAGLLLLQIPSSLLFYPLAAIFAITGIFVPVAIVLMGVGTLPYSFAMKYRTTWRGAGAPEEPAFARQPAVAGRGAG